MQRQRSGTHGLTCPLAVVPAGVPAQVQPRVVAEVPAGVPNSSTNRSTCTNTSSSGPSGTDGPPSSDSSSDKAKYMWLQSRRYLYEDPPRNAIEEVDRRTAARSSISSSNSSSSRSKQEGPVIGPEEPPFETTFTVLAERLQLWRHADSAFESDGTVGEAATLGSRKQRRRRRGLAPTGLVDGDPLAPAATAQSSVTHPHPHPHAPSAPAQRSRSRAGDALPGELLSSGLDPLGPARAGEWEGPGARRTSWRV